ncbi:MAG: fibronectin type III domain-containing protein, partial [Elusimicrobiota bacterium]|nr:fibronectin type III domain-containing protein [Elusimicrobiota bacterium]
MLVIWLFSSCWATVSTLTVVDGWSCDNGNTLSEASWVTNLNNDNEICEAYSTTGPLTTQANGGKWIAMYFSSFTLPAGDVIDKVEIIYKEKSDSAQSVNCCISDNSSTTKWSNATSDDESFVITSTQTFSSGTSWTVRTFDITQWINTETRINSLEVLFWQPADQTGRCWLDYVRVEVTHHYAGTYDYGSTTNKKAYEKLDADDPPAGGPILSGAVEFASTSYIRISVSDDIHYISSNTSTSNKCPAHEFQFKINEATNTITNIYVEWEGWGVKSDLGGDFGGGGGAVGGSSYGSKLFIWNISISSWVMISSHTASSDVTISSNIASEFTLYIDSSSYLYLAVLGPERGFTGSADIKTDYVKVVISTTDVTAPSAITTLSALTPDTTSQIKLTWIAPGDDGTTGPIENGEFRIQYSTNPDANEKGGWSYANYDISIPTTCPALSSHTRTVTGLGHNTTYYFRIWTRDEKPSNWSEVSNEAAQSTLCNPPIALGFREVYSSSMTVSWDPNGNPSWTKYLVECSSVAVGFQPPTASSWTTLSTYQPVNLSPNTTYYFRVKAQNNNGIDTEWISLNSTSTLCNLPIAQGFTDIYTSSITANWGNNGNPELTEYFCEVSSVTPFSSFNDSNWITLSSYTFSSLSPNCTYWFRVKARNWNLIETNYADLGSTHTLCNPPTDLVFQDVCISSITLQWSNNSNSHSTIYELEASTYTEGDYGVIYTGYELSYNHTGLTPNVTYYYKVRAKNLDDVYSNYTPSIDTHTLCNIPGKPGFTEVQVSSMVVQWSSNSNSSATVYELLISTDNIEWSIEVSTKSTNYTDTGLDPNTTYWYKVRAKNLDNIWTDYSDTSSTSTLCNPPLTQPLTNVYTSSITANWGKNSNPDWTKYLIECSSISLGGKVFKSSWTVNNSYVFESLDLNTTYYFRVKARNNNDVDTQWVSLDSTSTLCNPPQNLTATDRTTSSIDLSWDANSNPGWTVYEIEKSTNETNWEVEIATTSTNYTNTGLNEKSTYWYRVRAKNNNGIYTDYCDVFSTMTLSVPPSAISDLTGLTHNSIEGAVILSWTAPGDDSTTGTATTYIIKCSSESNIENEADFSNALDLSEFSTSPIPDPHEAGTSESFTITGLIPGVTYYFAIKGKDKADNVGSWSRAGVNQENYAIAYDTNPPAPTSLTAIAGFNQIDLEWTAPVPFPDDFDYYRVYCDSTSDTLWDDTFIATETVNTSWTHYELAGNNTYYYRITAVDTGPNILESDYSNVASTCPKIGGPSSPSNFVGTALSSTTIKWTWNDNSDNEDGFEIHTSTHGVLVSSNTLTAGTTEYLQQLLSPNTSSYYHHIHAVNQLGESNQANASPYPVWTLANMPMDLTISQVWSSSMSLTWNENSNPNWTKYGLSKSTDNFIANISTFIILTDNLTDTTTVAYSLSLNTTYWFRCWAYNEQEIQTDYIVSLATPTLANPPGTGPITDVSSVTIRANWTANSNPDGTQYNVEISSISEGGSILNNSGWITSLNNLFDSLTPNVTYWIRVKARNHANRETSYVNLGSTHTRCSVPVGLNFVEVSTDSIEISWQNNGNSDSTIYELEASTGIDNDYGVIYTGAGLSYTHSGLTPNVTYYYRVRARNLDGVYSNYTASIDTHTLCNTPGDISFTSVLETQIDLTWQTNNNSASTVYTLESSSETNTNYKQIYQGTNNSYSHTSLAPNVTYYYRVYATNLDGVNSGYNTPNSTHTLCNAPANLVFTGVTETDISVQWQANNNSGSTIYELEASTGIDNDYGV